MIFAALIIERPALEWSGLLGAVSLWLQDAGLYAFLWLLILGLSYFIIPEFRQRSVWGKMHSAMALLAGTSALLFACFLFVLFTQEKVPDRNAPKPTEFVPASAPPPMMYNPTQKLFFSLAGLAALVACSAPILRDLGQKRIIFRRIWAIARVAVKEAWSRGIVWVCIIIPLIYLYADWYISAKPEDQLRNRVSIAYFSMAILFILTAVLLGAFSIPGDLKSQNLFTIVTKPVERYEIVLGRFLGYALLLLVELTALTAISYLYVDRGLARQAVEESYHARVPLLGNKLYYHNTPDSTKGENVGREWTYRSYITGINLQSTERSVQYAVWTFNELPNSLVDRGEDATVRLEFSFDIYRTTTGLEGKGVYCSFTFARGDLSPEKVSDLLKPGGLFKSELFKQYKDAKERNDAKGLSADELDELNAQTRKEIIWKLFEKYGVFQVGGISVTDFHTQSEEIPAKIFKVLRQSAAAREPAKDDDNPPVLQIFVNVEDDPYSRGQRVGMAQADLYLLAEDRPFWINFFKGALCIYLIACIVLGLAVVSSTYLTGIISLLITLLLCLGGLFLPFMKSLRDGHLYGGGPLEALYRLANRQGTNAHLDQQSAAISVITVGDNIYRWWLGFIMNVIPDVAHYYPADYVSNGFDITWGTLLVLNHILPVAGYLVPWLMLAYYLIKSREIANP